MVNVYNSYYTFVSKIFVFLWFLVPCQYPLFQKKDKMKLIGWEPIQIPTIVEVFSR